MHHKKKTALFSLTSSGAAIRVCFAQVKLRGGLSQLHYTVSASRLLHAADLLFCLFLVHQEMGNGVLLARVFCLAGIPTFADDAP